MDSCVISNTGSEDIEYRFGNVKADVSDIASSIPCSISDDGSEVRLRFGDADRFVTGIQRYQYSYRYTLPADDYSDYDELYYNIVSADSWDSPMESMVLFQSSRFPSHLMEELYMEHMAIFPQAGR